MYRVLESGDSACANALGEFGRLTAAQGQQHDAEDGEQHRERQEVG
jgi:hypothetical protein